MHSPCVARCGLNEDDYCMGCYRHIDEIVVWSSASDEQKKHIWDQLEARKAQFSDSENCQTLSRAKWLEAEKRLI
ncbi:MULTISPECIES: DUF1289 domain-containing protein [Pseudomonadati]|jgi:predicted Fe-S protein YdhL (DUF1289 family)|uniref:DUF1289 domain-containing protein n=1 Tax=Shewanella aestuarii TaxID=1028752 RepID=A0ABT0L4J2_9GAMM|nr:DUF1289 domain-containing protein [Shewanella aestuarii]MCL1118637.1 DUF1289 domain-containing protein [Shewanella aestuarii]GGN83485.1 DUF1289 domain-containing protein [Shewanella aestuarii]